MLPLAAAALAALTAETAATVAALRLRRAACPRVEVAAAVQQGPPLASLEVVDRSQGCLMVVVVLVAHTGWWGTLLLMRWQLWHPCSHQCLVASGP